MYNFGSGDAFLIPNVPNPTSVPCDLQEFQLDFKFDKKTLHGKQQFPIAVARSKGSIEGSLKNTSVTGGLFNQVFFGDAAQTGAYILATKEAARIPSVTPFTSDAANKTGFVLDCGIIDAETGASFTRVASNPSGGEYAVTDGTYTFAEADKGRDILLSYTYETATGGTTTIITNKNMGTAPQFKLVYMTEYESRKFIIQLNACSSADLKLAAKNEDWLIPEIKFDAFADRAGSVGIISLAG